MLAFDLEDRPHRAGLLQGHFLHLAEILLAMHGFLGVSVRAVLGDADKLRITGDLPPVDRHRIDDCRTPLSDARLEPARVNQIGRVGLCDAQDRARCHVADAGCERQRRAGFRPGNRRKAGPFDGAVLPVCQRPALQRQGLASGSLQGEELVLLDRPLYPGNAPTHALRQGRRRGIEPLDRHFRPGVRYQRQLLVAERTGPLPVLPSAIVDKLGES